MLDFTEESQRLVSAFFTYRNDIDIYTEDEYKDKEFYKVLLNKIVDNSIRINDVTPLGSKTNVLKRCLEEPNNGRKKLFIVDGDINLIHGLNIPILPNLYVLQAYCIENLLFDEKTIIRFIYLNCGTKSEEEIIEQLDFSNWLTKYTDSLVTLFLHFALLDLFGAPFTLSNVHKFHKVVKGESTYDNTAVENEVESIKKEIILIRSEDDYNHNLALLRDQWASNIKNLLKIVSGKDYLIPLLLIKTQSFKKSKSMPSLEEVKLLLATVSDVSRLDGLKQRIEREFN